MTSIQTIMTADESGAELVEYAKQAATALDKADIKHGQIRNIFNEMRKIENLWPGDEAVRRLNMLKPKLSYQRKRLRRGQRKFETLEKDLSNAIDLVTNASEKRERNDRFQRLVNLLEAITAYHHE